MPLRSISCPQPGVKGARNMKFVFTDKKVNLPDSVHQYAEKKVGKLDRFFREIGRAHV